MIDLALSREHKYSFRDEDEVLWRFQWGREADRMGWWAWFLKPSAQEWFCLGLISEEDVEARLIANPPKLEDDDMIGLGLFLTVWPPEINLKETTDEESTTSDSGSSTPGD